MKFELEDYQLELYERLLIDNRVFNLLDMGMGKTLPSLMAVRDNFEMEKALLISKENILLSWVNDNDKFELGLNIALPIGTKAKRDKIINNATNTDILGVSVFNIDWLVKNHLNKLLEFDILIIDESTLFKNRATNRYKYLLEILSLKQWSKIWLLSGTPFLNFEAIYNQVYILDKGQRLGRNITSFRNRYMRKHPYIKHVWTDNKSLEGNILSKIKDLTFNAIRQSKFTFNYKFIESENMLTEELNELINYRVYNGEIIETPAILYTRIMQLLAKNKSKYDTLINLIKDNKIENAIIVINLVEAKNRVKIKLESEFKKVRVFEKKYQEDIQNAFNDNKINYLIVNSNNISHGVNLQFSQAYNIIYVSPYGIGLDSYMQLNKRLARRGNNNSNINVYHVFNDTIELKYYKDLKSGKFKMDRFLKDLWYNSTVER